jgi:hypothetical protein
MQIIRREFLRLSGLAGALPSIASGALAQTPAGPKLTPVLRKDLEGQGETVQETVVSMVDFGPGTSAPWHMHPGAQETLARDRGEPGRRDRRPRNDAAQGRRSRHHRGRSCPSRPQREHRRGRQSTSCPQPGRQGQATDRPDHEIDRVPRYRDTYRLAQSEALAMTMIAAPAIPCSARPALEIRKAVRQALSGSESKEPCSDV